MSEEALADLGRGGKRGYLAFRELTTEKEGETQDVANFRQSLNCLGRTINSSLPETALEIGQLGSCWRNGEDDRPPYDLRNR